MYWDRGYCFLSWVGVVLGLGLSVCPFVVCVWVRPFFSWWVPPFFSVSVLCVLGSFSFCLRCLRGRLASSRLGVLVGSVLVPSLRRGSAFLFVGFSYAFFFFSSCLRFCWSCFCRSCCSCSCSGVVVPVASCVLGWSCCPRASRLGAVLFFRPCLGGGVVFSCCLSCWLFGSCCCVCSGR